MKHNRHTFPLSCYIDGKAELLNEEITGDILIPETTMERHLLMEAIGGVMQANELNWQAVLSSPLNGGSTFGVCREGNRSHFEIYPFGNKDRFMPIFQRDSHFFLASVIPHHGAFEAVQKQAADVIIRAIMGKAALFAKHDSHCFGVYHVDNYQSAVQFIHPSSGEPTKLTGFECFPDGKVRVLGEQRLPVVCSPRRDPHIEYRIFKSKPFSLTKLTIPELKKLFYAFDVDVDFLTEE